MILSRIVLHTDGSSFGGSGDWQGGGEAVERFRTALPPYRPAVRRYTILRLVGSHSTLRFST